MLVVAHRLPTTGGGSPCAILASIPVQTFEIFGIHTGLGIQLAQTHASLAVWVMVGRRCGMKKHGDAKNSGIRIK